MKTSLIVLACTATAVAVDPPHHQAFGPVRFGPPNLSSHFADHLPPDIARVASPARYQPSTAALIQKYFVTNGARFTARLASKYPTYSLDFAPEFGAAVETLRVSSLPADAEQYDTKTKEGWEILQDIANSKFFKHATRGTFPKRTDITGSPDFFRTDEWMEDNVKIELGIESPKPPDFKYRAVLRASEIPATGTPAPPAAK